MKFLLKIYLKLKRWTCLFRIFFKLQVNLKNLQGFEDRIPYIQNAMVWVKKSQQRIENQRSAIKIKHNHRLHPRRVFECFCSLENVHSTSPLNKCRWKGKLKERKKERIHLRKENLIRKIDEKEMKNSGVLCVPIVTFYDVSGCSRRWSEGRMRQRTSLNLWTQNKVIRLKLYWIIPLSISPLKSQSRISSRDPSLLSHNLYLFDWSDVVDLVRMLKKYIDESFEVAVEDCSHMLLICLHCTSKNLDGIQLNWNWLQWLMEYRDFLGKFYKKKLRRFAGRFMCKSIKQGRNVKTE